MKKDAIRGFAVWAREELISRVAQKAYFYGIQEHEIAAITASYEGRLLTQEELAQRKKLVARIEAHGYRQVVEEIAYTWFNRFCALRFMEVNGYLPVKVFAGEDGSFQPHLLTESIHLDMDNVDMAKVYALLEGHRRDELYKYLLVAQCNALSKPLPGMFQPINDETELLFPDNLLLEGSVLDRMLRDIPEGDWKNQVQIIGWLYQYYNSAPKDQVFADLKRNIKISKEKIPAATQLFTPDWIVRYMVENSLGRLWIEHERAGQAGAASEQAMAEGFGWRYYLPGAEQEPAVQEQLDAIRKDSCANLRLEGIKVIDPCMGSGHILVYMFDVLMQLYTAAGSNARDAVRSILTHNLYGLDIDDRAAQLAYFAVMMKAQYYDKRFLRREDNPTPHIYAVQESNDISRSCLDSFGVGMDRQTCAGAQAQLSALLDGLRDAKEYGSILNVPEFDWNLLRRFVSAVATEGQVSLEEKGIWDAQAKLLSLIEIGQMLAQKYSVVCTNPPYMGSSGMGGTLAEFVKKNYPDSKSDLFAVFIERCGQMLAANGYQAMITQHAWMFLSSFEKLRTKLLLTDTVNMAHLGARAFDEIGGEVVQTTSFVLRKSHIPGCKGVYCRLIEPTTQQGKADMFLSGENRYEAAQDNFSKIPGAPIAYWVSEKIADTFVSCRCIRDYAEPRHGMSTGNNDVCLKIWFEVNISKIMFDADCLEIFDNSGCKYAPYKKGGSFRLWYGNNDYIIAYDASSREYMNHLPGFRSSSTGFFFKPSINWSDVSSSYFGVRVSPKGFAFDGRGASMFCKESDALYLAALLASKFAYFILDILNPTLTFNIENVAAIPVRIDETQMQLVNVKANKCVQLSKKDWDSFETSWDFQKHPLI